VSPARNRHKATVNHRTDVTDQSTDPPNRVGAAASLGVGRAATAVVERTSAY
jgi:hypothetical protein